MAHYNSVKVIDHCQISPARGSVPATAASIPLNFLDVCWILCRQPMQRLFFYEFPHPTPYFIHKILPPLKASLAFTLQHFYPFAANLIYPPRPYKPHLVFTDGDSVPFTVAESAVDFGEIIGDHVRDVRELHPFVPKLPPSRLAQDRTRTMLPLLALQVTLFPNAGLCIGIAFRHVAADGMAFNHFVKFWAFVFGSSGEGEFAHQLEKWLPSHDKTIIKDPNELESVFLESCWEWTPPEDYHIDSTHDDSFADKVRATFAIGKDRIDELKRRVWDHTLGQLRVSTFAVTCAIIWVGLIKSEELCQVGASPKEDDKLCYLAVLADCRQRLETKLPDNYFGNCIGLCYVPAKRSELLADNGIVVAGKAIGEKVDEYLGGGVLKGAERWYSTYKEIQEEGNSVISIAGSPRLRVYETDFGWGRPKKTEVVHIDVSGSISLSDSRDGGGGVEVGLALTRSKMDVFTAVFEQHLKQI